MSCLCSCSAFQVSSFRSPSACKKQSWPILACFLAKPWAAVVRQDVVAIAAATVEKGFLDIRSGAMPTIQWLCPNGERARRAPESATVTTCIAVLGARKALATRRLVMPDRGKLQGLWL